MLFDYYMPCNNEIIIYELYEVCAWHLCVFPAKRACVLGTSDMLAPDNQYVPGTCVYFPPKRACVLGTSDMLAPGNQYVPGTWVYFPPTTVCARHKVQELLFV